MLRTLLVLACIPLVLAGCDSQAPDPRPANSALSTACDRVNLAIPNDMDRDTWVAYAESLAQWSTVPDAETRAALEPVVLSARRFANAPRAERAARRAQWWESFGDLAQACRTNGSPMLP